MAISNEARKRLWARSGNACALCHQELIRPDRDGMPGALVGEEAHIVARSAGGPRYEPLDPEVRDGYANLILLCGNDHTEIDSQPARYTVEILRALKQYHEDWVAAGRPGARTDAEADGATVAFRMETGGEIWDLMHHALAYQSRSPEDLTDDEAELVDGALQVFVDWGDIAEDVVMHGFSAVRDGKRSVQAELDALAAAGFVVLGGEREGPLAGGSVTGKIAVLDVVREADLAGLRLRPKQSTQRADDRKGRSTDT